MVHKQRYFPRLKEVRIDPRALGGSSVSSGLYLSESDQGLQWVGRCLMSQRIQKWSFGFRTGWKVRGDGLFLSWLSWHAAGKSPREDAPPGWSGATWSPLGSHAALAGVTLTPGGHRAHGLRAPGSARPPDRSALTALWRDACLCFSLEIIFRDGPQDLTVFSFS